MTPPVPLNSGGAAIQTTNLAVGSDGIRFEQPEQGLVEFNGTRRNNVESLRAPDNYRGAAATNPPRRRNEEDRTKCLICRPFRSRP